MLFNKLVLFLSLGIMLAACSKEDSVNPNDAKQPNTLKAAVTSSTTWQSFTISTQTGTFTAAYDAVPNAANMDGVTGIQNGTANAYSGQACAVRFYTNGKIEARNRAGGGLEVIITLPLEKQPEIGEKAEQ